MDQGDVEVFVSLHMGKESCSAPMKQGIPWIKMLYLLGMILGLVVDPVIQAIGRMMFEDDLRMRVLEVRLRCRRGVCFKPSVKGRLKFKGTYNRLSLIKCLILDIKCQILPFSAFRSEISQSWLQFNFHGI